MLLGWVSDEHFRPLAGVWVDVLNAQGEHVETLCAGATGGLWAELASGQYELVLAAPGMTPKRTTLRVPEEAPKNLRLISQTLYGYVWPKWVQGGQRARLCVHSPEQYHASLWRYGLHKQQVCNWGWFDEHAPGSELQQVPDGDWTQQPLNWGTLGYGGNVHSQWVQAPERSGLYYIHLRTPSGRELGMPWVVAPRAPEAPVAVLLSTLTWNAYNSFGGRSNYLHPEGLPSAPPVHARSEISFYTREPRTRYTVEHYPPLHFERPEPWNHVPLDHQAWEPIPGRNACHLAPAEWRLLAWLERQGVAYDTWADVQLHAGEMPLESYRVLVLGPHPEYWTESMYWRVKRWVWERGGRLIYLGGNGINCAVTLAEDLSWMQVLNGDQRRQWHQGIPSRFADRVEPEAALLGVMYDTRGVMTAAPYQVVQAKHWAFEGTGLKAGECFGRFSLHERVPGGASGHETDKRCRHSPPGTALLAKGTNPDQGGAEMIYYRTPSGGEVFAAGSITYVAALLVDPQVSQVTQNVFSRFLQG